MGAWADYLARIALLAGLYVLTGKLGLLFALPPGYATMIWPPSGIALGALLVYGWRQWPGILIGSFLLNAYVSGLFSHPDTLTQDKVLPAVFIAIGSTLQALAGYGMARRFFGVPLKFDSVRQVLAFFAVCAPLACVIAASVGVSALHFFGQVSDQKFIGNWITWWTGDCFGVALFLPLVLISPWNRKALNWRGSPVSGLPLTAMILLILPLGLTFYVWKIDYESVRNQSESEFEKITRDSEMALQSRMVSYEHALVGGAAFYQNIGNMTQQKWRDYISSIPLKDRFPGILGVGLIFEAANVNDFVSRAKEDGISNFTVHPDVDPKSPHYIIKFIEPLALNKPAVGLNIAFEAHRLEAAQLSRDTHKSAITKKIALVQDNQHLPGFLLMYPMYRKPGNGGRESFDGWVYAPLIAQSFLQGLSSQQEKLFNIKVYDGDDERPDNLIYASDNKRKAAEPLFVVRKQIDIMQQHWLIVWSSTPQFEKNIPEGEPALVLTFGLMFSGMFCLFLLMITVRRTGTLELIVQERGYILPVVVLLLSVGGVLFLFDTVRDREIQTTRSMLIGQVHGLGALTASRASDTIGGLMRMAGRWDASDGTPENQWRSDAASYLTYFKELSALEWIDSTYHVRWVEPFDQNRRVVGLNVLFDKERELALRGAEMNSGMIVTPPLDLVQGYKAIIAYVPVYSKGRFDGLIAGIISIESFISSALSEKDLEDFSVRLLYKGTTIYSHDASGALYPDMVVEYPVRIGDKNLVLQMIPSDRIVSRSQDMLPIIILIFGLVSSGLLTLTVRAVLLAKIRSAYLQDMNNLNNTIISSTSNLMIAVDANGVVLLFNKTAEMALGYSAADIVGKTINPVWHDRAEIEARADELSREIGLPVSPNIEVFNVVPRREGQEVREWTFIHRDGHRFPGRETVCVMRNAEGEIFGYLAVIEDVSEQRQAEVDRRELFDRLVESNTDLEYAMMMAEAANKAKSTFLANMSHEIRTPLNGVISTAELLKAMPLTEKQRHYVDIIQESGELLLSLLNDVLDLSKIEIHKLELYDAPFDLVKTITFSVNLFGSAAELKNIQIKVSLAPDLPRWVMGDHHRFAQILTNLVGNAVKYTPSGMISVSASVNRLPGGDFLYLEVNDTGVGVPANARDKIFERFSQAHKSSAINGTGLGLSICKSLVSLMGGAIGVNSIEGKGSTFWFRIPLREAVQPSHPDQMDDIIRGESYTGAHILLAEDLEINRTVIGDMLQSLGCRVDTAVNGLDAVERCAKIHYDLVLMDCDMPVMNGYEATRQLRKKYGDALPIVAISAHAFIQDIQQCLDCGMNDYVHKPVKMETLAHALEKWVHRNPDVKPSIPAAAISAPTEERELRFDPSILEEWKSKSPEKARRFADMTLADAKRLYAEIQEAVTGHDAAKLRSAAHGLKSVTGQVGGIYLSTLCADLELAAAGEDWDLINVLMPRVVNFYNEFLNIIEQAAG